MSEEEIFAVVRNYVPGAVIPFLSGAEEKWASELRRVSVIFFNLVCHIFLLGYNHHVSLVFKYIIYCIFSINTFSVFVDLFAGYE